MSSVGDVVFYRALLLLFFFVCVTVLHMRECVYMRPFSVLNISHIRRIQYTIALLYHKTIKITFPHFTDYR